MANDTTSEAPRRRLRGVVLIGGENREAIEQVVRGLPPLDAAVILSCDVDAPGLSALRRASTMPIADSRDVAPLTSGEIIVVPRHADIRVADGRLHVDGNGNGGNGNGGNGNGGNGNGNSADRQLRALADGLGSDAVAVIMPGTDGEVDLGVKRIKEVGGMAIRVIADTAEPRASDTAHGRGVAGADLVIPVSELPRRLGAFARRPPTLLDEDAGSPDTEQDTLREVLTLVRLRTGHDFSNYKRATLYRRIARRMQLCETESITAYHRRLNDDPTELGQLLRDFLISVTNFFRDTDAFEALQPVISKIFRHRGNEQVRVWVAGCATGEEAYSIAILLAEHAARVNAPPAQVFATDIDEAALAEARAGRYPESIAIDVTPDRIDRFFQAEGGGYRMRKELRDMILFSPHNVLRDPPFSRLDLVTCRNLLIYINRDAQDRVLNVFHFGLRPDGYLFLGSSETAESAAALFTSIDAKHRIYARRMAPSSLGFDTVTNGSRWQLPIPAPAIGHGDHALAFGDLHHRVVEKYAPPSVLVDDELDVVHVSQHAGKYLTVSGGEPTRQLLRLVMPALRLDLRAAIYAARQPGTGGADRRVVRFDDDGEVRVIRIETRMVELPELDRNMVLVMFDEREPHATDHAIVTASSADAQIEPVVRELEDDLHRTREQLRTSIEQYETSLEELKASNEELHAINEELRSATEELETAKEEQQSVNEELTAVNYELKSKVDEISLANSDLQNLMMSTDIGVLFLDRELNIKRFTPRAQTLINVIASDIGRPLDHLTHRLDYDDLSAAARSVLNTLRAVEREVRSVDGRRFLARLLPYRALDDRVEGVVLTFVDVSDLRAAEDAHRSSAALLRHSEARFLQALRAAPLVAFNQDSQLRLTWGYVLGEEVDLSGKTDADLFGPVEAARLVAIKREIVATGAGARVEIPMMIDGVERIFDFRIEPIRDNDANNGLRTIGFDITPSKVAEAALRDADARKDQFLATISHELRAPLAPLRAALDIQRLAPSDPERVARARAIMERQVDHLIRLVDDLLDLSRVAENKIAIDSHLIDLHDVFVAAVEGTRPTMEKEGHTVVVQASPGPIRIVGDTTRLTQVLVNLLSNAAKYTPPAGRIELAASIDSSVHMVNVYVRDNGIGMPPDLLPRVFDMFVQGNEVAGHSSGGLGIGLNLVQRIVELHGGTVTAHSDGPGRGSELRIRLPLAPDDATPAAIG